MTCGNLKKLPEINTFGKSQFPLPPSVGDQRWKEEGKETELRKEGNKAVGKSLSFFRPFSFTAHAAKLVSRVKVGKAGEEKKCAKKVRKERCNYCGTAAAAAEQKEEGKIGVFFQRFLSFFSVFSVRREGRQCIKLLLFRSYFLSNIVLAAAKAQLQTWLRKGKT